MRPPTTPAAPVAMSWPISSRTIQRGMHKRSRKATVPNGKGIFWKIEKPGVKPSWLLGSMHVTDPRVLTCRRAPRPAHDAADTIVIESDEILDEKKASAAL
jgi:uncharacterized protein YbaP (TraB family)